MDSAPPAPADAAPAPADRGPGRGRRLPAGRLADLLVGLAYLLGAFWVTGRGWLNVHGRLLGSRPDDQGFNEWMLAHAAHAVTHLENPFVTTLQNAPEGVNLMSNVGLQLPGILLTPVTLLGGAPLSYLVLITLNLAGTAFAWYWVLSRHLVRSHPAAVVGGLFCAFAPAMITHSNGHPHITAQWLVPFLVWRVVRLTRAGASVREGLILGALVAAQFFISVEVLFLVALGVLMATVAHLVLRPRETLRLAPRALAALGVAGGLVLLVTAYPLWMQFAGPQHRIGHPGDPDVYTLRLKSFVAYATESIGGGPDSARGLAPNTTEQASFYGWPVVLLVAAVIVALRRELGVRVLAVVALVSGVLALGSTLSWGPEKTDIPAPFVLLHGLPIVDAMVIARFALITTVAVGLLLALAVARVDGLAARAPQVAAPLRLLTAAALVAALVPMLPTPLPAKGRVPVPQFVTSGEWRQHVAEGRTLVPVPVHNMTSINWGSAALAEFAVPQGYFLGPTSPTDDTGRWGTEPRPTARLLTAVGAGTRPPTVDAVEREQAVTDVRWWKADAVVLPKHAHEAELKAFLEACFGPGRRVRDVWVWDVRPLTR
ncbi:hypothetical protein D7223_17795 [Micromonospora endolithica]|uniref:DUF6311 domain-containing protein n=1 Tax=Micromonospora endolithica TaxID=230091 RepID=A0A3A9ZAY6_9ACTN|nr:hypothetical protein D7223_17795 [Micromonospora endolithica]TWJ22828.1 hypothetical protein JD76_02950 [Micromonospora endolithica]